MVEAMQQFAALTDRARAALQARDSAALAEVINANYDLRRSICPLHPGHVAMIECARSIGATAKYAGSGGAIIGTFSDDAMLAELTSRLAEVGCRVVRPSVAVHLSKPPSETT